MPPGFHCLMYSVLCYLEEDLPVISFTRTDIQARDDDNCNVKFKASVSHFTNRFLLLSHYTLTLIVVVCKEWTDSSFNMCTLLGRL